MIGKRIKIVRKQKGISQDELAIKVGFSNNTAISKIERGERKLSENMLMKVANALNVSPVYLLMGEEWERGSEEDEILLEMVKALSPEQKKMLIAQIKGILSDK